MRIQFYGIVKDLVCRDAVRFRVEASAKELPNILKAVAFGMGRACRLKLDGSKFKAQLVDARIRNEGDAILTFLADSSVLPELGSVALTQRVLSVIMRVSGEEEP